MTSLDTPEVCEESKAPQGLGMKRTKRLMNFDALPGNLSQSGRDPTDTNSSILSDPFLFGRAKPGLNQDKIKEAYLGIQ